ncbi:RCC1 domain-containing protein [Pigmentibacter ruber]|uniref:RCC1 domain-containing protein n=1 Tax=Pigmentibacter ruber TaxID=2683196 RepID=UPI00131E9737|nr:hypothetical protein [Pigmentibacter ruber]
MKINYNKNNEILFLSLVFVHLVSCGKKNNQSESYGNLNKNFASVINLVPEYKFYEVVNSSQNLCAIEKKFNAIYCWNKYSDSDSSGIPSEHFIINDKKYQKIVISENILCAKNDENKWVCGKNPTKKLDFQNPKELNLPINANFMTLTLSEEKICGINKNDELVYCWDFDVENKKISENPYLLSTTKFLDFKINGSKVLNTEFSCGIDKDKFLHCMGNNNFGQLGLGNKKNSSQFKKIENNLKWKQVELGNSHTCALSEQNEMYCWGSNNKAQLGINAFSKKYENNIEKKVCNNIQNNCLESATLPQKIENFNNISKIFVNSDTSCFKDSSNKLYCFGDNTYGQLNNNSDTLIQQNIESNLGSKYSVLSKALKISNLEFTNISISNSSLCGISANNEKLQCYGFLFKNRFSKISVGLDTACGLTSSENGNHLLCLNTNLKEPNSLEASPWNTSQLMPWTSQLSYIDIQQSKEYSCAIRKDNQSIDCWSKSENTLINKISNSINKVLPINYEFKNEKGIKLEFVKISTGVNHICGIDKLNTAYCWGNNSSGQLGDGSYQFSKLPVKVITEDQENIFFKDISVGDFHTCAVSLNDKLYCWGENKQNQLGDPSIPLSYEYPNLIDLINVSFKKVLADGNYSCAESNSNDLYCWGNSFEGIFVNPDNTLIPNQKIPKKIDLNQKFISFSTRDGTICIVNQKNELFCKGKSLNQKNKQFIKIERPYAQNFYSVSVGYKNICGIRKIDENLTIENPYVFDASIDCWKN